MGAQCLDDDPRLAGVNYVDLPASDSMITALLNWPRTFIRLWRAIGSASIVHAGVAEWPIPTGWAATIATKLRRAEIADQYRIRILAITEQRILNEARPFMALGEDQPVVRPASGSAALHQPELRGTVLAQARAWTRFPRLLDRRRERSGSRRGGAELGCERDRRSAAAVRGSPRSREGRY